MTDPASVSPVAIIGMGCMFPAAPDLPAYWANIRDGVDAIAPIPASHFSLSDHYDADPKAQDRTYGKKGGFLAPVQFDPMWYGIPPRDIVATDTTQLLGLMAAEAALRDAGYVGGDKELPRATTSVILGVTGALELVVPLGARLQHPIWRRALAEAGVADDVAQDVVRRISDAFVPWQENSFPGLLGNVAAGRIANRLDLHGTNCVVDAACASSLAALHLGLLELRSGNADVVLAGGLDTFNDIFMYTCFSKTPALSQSGDARPFDDAGDGTTLGEGLGIVVLKRLDDAQRDGDRIYAVIRGLGSSSDGRGQAIYAPDAEGQARALRAAYAEAGVEPESVGLLEAHGTGTRVGDATEIEGLCRVYGGRETAAPWCALGSVKSMIGHTKAASGAAGLIKAALALHHRVLPPTIKVQRPNAAIDGTPFYVNPIKRPWVAKDGAPRRAGVSAFGFGGSNFHCVLEEHTPTAAADGWDGRVQLLAWSAATRDELVHTVRDFVQTLASDATWSAVRTAASDLRRRFASTDAYRVLVPVTADESDLAGFVRAVADRLASGNAEPGASPRGDAYGHGDPVGQVGLLFPGQGAQRVGMLRDLSCTFGAFVDTLGEAERAVPGLTDRIYPMATFDEARDRERAEALRATEHAQPALGAVSLGAWRVLERFGVRADAAVGHSYGELVALCVAGAIPPAALGVVSRRRGEAMAAGDGDLGGMIAVATDLDALEAWRAEHAPTLVLANRNAPKQGVLSGPTADVDAAGARLHAEGIRHRRLWVGAAFHSPLVAGAVAAFGDALADVPFEPPRLVVYGNATAQPYPTDAAAARSALAGQLAAPVDFVGCIERMWHDGVRVFVEVGPGRRLTGLVRSILGDRTAVLTAVEGSEGRRGGVEDLARTLAALGAAGVPLDLTAWDPAPARPARTPGPAAITVVGAHPRPTAAPRPPLPSATQERLMPIPPSSASPPLPTTPVPDPAATDLRQRNLAALLAMQAQTAEVHRRFLETQAEATRAFESLLLDTALTVPTGAAASTMAVTPAVTAVTAAPAAPVPAAPMPAALAPVTTPSAASSGMGGGRPVLPTVIEIIADKTGYPPQMLAPTMGLDADLGIDSIKRVEILSALAEALPDAPAIGPEHLGTLQTLGDIAAHLSRRSVAVREGGPGAPVAAAAVALPTKPAAASAASSTVADVARRIVADKTGYPVEMLDLELGLESDLGIDSIKRVEILSALAEALPTAPAIGPEHLGELQTLGHIVAHLAGTRGDAPAPVADAPAPVVPTPESSPEPTPEPTPEPSGVLRFEPTLVPVELGDATPAALAEGTVLVTHTDDGLGEAIAAALEADGVPTTVVSLGSLATEASIARARVAGVVLVAPPRGDARGFLADALHALVSLAPALHAATARGRVLVASVTQHDGGFGFTQAGAGSRVEPAFAGVAGLIKTVGLEWTGVLARCIDVDPDGATAEQASHIATVLRTPGPVELAVRTDGVAAVELVPKRGRPAPGVRLGPQDVVVVTGGARGVTAAVAEAIARAGAPRLLLLGRTAPLGQEPAWMAAAADEASLKRALLEHGPARRSPRELQAEYERITAGREVARTLERLRAAGARATYRRVDIRDDRAVASCLSAVTRELGPVTALVHGAGVLADCRLEDKTAEDFDRVYGTKVDGLHNLLRHLHTAPLRAIVLFSSSTARFGRRGQADYAIANEALNKIAQVLRRTRPRCRVLSLGFGPWDGGMVTPALRRMFAGEGVGVIGLEGGGRFVVDELAGEGPAEVVVMGAGSRLPTEFRPGLRSTRRRAPELPVVFERQLDVDSHPVLADHVIGGKAVLPAALMFEWLAHGALHGNPGLRFRGLDGLRILRGLRLAPDHTLAIRVGAGTARREGDAFVVPTELVSGGNNGHRVVHARADVRLADAELAAPPVPAPPAGLEPAPTDVARVYADVLFHGERLHALTHIDGIGPDGVVARARCAPAPRTWMTAPVRGRWIADPLLLDAGMQAAIVWSHVRLGVLSLPASLGHYLQYRSARDAAQVRVTVRHRGQHHLVADIDWVDDAGLIARLTDYECTLEPSLRKAFAARTLAAS